MTRQEFLRGALGLALAACSETSPLAPSDGTAETLDGKSPTYARLPVDAALVADLGPDVTVDAPDAADLTDAADAADASAPGTLAWTLAWDTEGIESEPGEPGWRVVTDRGHAIHLSNGTVTTWDASLVPCEGPKNHSGNTNETSADAPLIEALHNPLPAMPWAARTGLAGRYCGGHYVIARADAATGTDGRAVHRDRISLHLELTWSIGAGAPVPLTLDAGFGYGAFLPLPEGLDAVDFTERSLSVTLLRRPATLFDGIDFETSSPENVGRDVLRNLVDGAALLGE